MPSQPHTGSRRLGDHGETYDLVFLAAVVALSAAPYLAGLGFYSDDWSFLADLHFAADPSLAGMLRALSTNAMRPVQALYLTVLYRMFGQAALWYHVVNTAVLLAAVLLLYRVLREAALARVLALSAALLFALRPDYSTDRFWYSAFQAPLALFFYLLSVYADLRTLRSRGPAQALWKAASLASIVVGALAYELFVPLTLLNPMVVWWRNRSSAAVSSTSDACEAVRMSPGRLAAYSSMTIAVVAFIVVAKILLAQDSIGVEYPGHLVWFVRLLVLAAVGSYVDFGLALPITLPTLLAKGVSGVTLTLAVPLSIGVFVYLAAVAARAHGDVFARRTMGALIGVGGVVFVAGYGIFLTSGKAIATPTGINNRIAIAASLGVGLSMVGAVGWASGLAASAQARRVLFCSAVTALSLGGYLANAALARHWAAAYKQAQAVLTDIRRDVATLAPGTTLLLDGVCRYVGPGVVFESVADLPGALRLAYGHAEIHADVLTGALEVGDDGLTTMWYGAPFFYAYADELIVYDARSHAAYPLADAQAARDYFADRRDAAGARCPFSREGYGEPILGGVLDRLLVYRHGGHSTP